MERAIQAAEVAFEGIQSALEIIFAPWLIGSSALRHVLENEDSVNDWIRAKVSELSNVSVTASVIGATITGAFTWELASGPDASAARACWYAALVLALMSATMSTQQSNLLNRAMCYQENTPFKRKLIGLGDYNSTGGRVSVRQKLSLYIWQTPIMLLNFSIGLALAGIIILVVCKETNNIIIAMSVAFGITSINYIFCTLMLNRVTALADKSGHIA